MKQYLTLLNPTTARTRCTVSATALVAEFLIFFHGQIITRDHVLICRCVWESSHLQSALHTVLLALVPRVVGVKGWQRLVCWAFILAHWYFYSPWRFKESFSFSILFPFTKRAGCERF